MQALTSLIQSLGSHQSPASLLFAGSHGTWLSEIANQNEISPCLTWSIRALSISHVGRQTRDSGLTEGSRTLYGTALHFLDKAIQDPTARLSTDTLSATLLLSFYEALACTEKEAWIRHAGGASKLICLRGPDRHRSGLGRLVLLASRYSIIMEALQTRKACFLAQRKWKDLFCDIEEECSKDDSSRSPFYKAKEAILAEIVDHPAFLSDAVGFMASESTSCSELVNLISRGQIHSSNYKRLHRTMIRILRSEGRLSEEVPSSSNDELFPNRCPSAQRG